MEYLRNCGHNDASPTESSTPRTSWAEADAFTPRNGDVMRLTLSSSPSNLFNWSSEKSSEESGLGSSIGTSIGDILLESSSDYVAPRDPFAFSEGPISERFNVGDSKGVFTFTATTNCTDVSPDNPELYVKCIPAESTPAELIQFLERAGPLYKLRFMVDESNCSRGYAYVTYATPDATRAAIEKLDDRPFGRWSTLLRVGLCQVNRRIFVGGIPTNKTRDDTWRELLHKGVGGIVDVIMYRSYHNRAHNRGFVFVEFRSHQEAAVGRRLLRKSQMWGRGVIVDWSIPNPEASEEVLAQVKILFLRNLDVNMDRTELLDFIRSYISREKIEKVYKFKDYAFIHLYERLDAENLKQFLIRHFRNSCVEVHWANPSNALTDPQHRLKRVAKQTNCPRNWSASKLRNLPSEPMWSTADHDSVGAEGGYPYSQQSSRNRLPSFQPSSGRAHIDFRALSDRGSQVQVCYDTTLSGSDLRYAHGASSTPHCSGTSCSTNDLYPSSSKICEVKKPWMKNCSHLGDDASHNTNTSQFSVNSLRSRTGTTNNHSAPLLDQGCDNGPLLEMNCLLDVVKRMCSRGITITLQDIINMLGNSSGE